MKTQNKRALILLFLGVTLSFLTGCKSQFKDQLANGTDLSSIGATTTSTTTTTTTSSTTTTTLAGNGVTNAWIAARFASVPQYSQAYTSRTTIETPALVYNSTGTNAKYVFDVKETGGTNLPEVAFSNVTVTNLVSGDSFGAAIQTSGAPGAKLFLSRVTIEPGWPDFVSYAATNYDGIVLDNSAEFYAEDLTIKNWNADGGIDNKAPISQFVRLKIEGKGHRAIRFWGAGPHYIVNSSVDNTGAVGEGTIFWFYDCTTAVVRIYNSTFNGSATVPANKIVCDSGVAPTLTYLNTDPRTTGEMHPMFVP